MQKELIVHEVPIRDYDSIGYRKCARTQKYMNKRWRSYLQELPYNMGCLMDGLARTQSTILDCRGTGHRLAFGYTSNFGSVRAVKNWELDNIQVHALDTYRNPHVFLLAFVVKILPKSGKVAFLTEGDVKLWSDGAGVRRDKEHIVVSSYKSGTAIDSLDLLPAGARSEIRGYLAENRKYVRVLHIADIHGVSQEEITTELLDALRIAYTKYKFLESSGL